MKNQVYNKIKGDNMEISDITIELMFDKIKSLEKEVNSLKEKVAALEHFTDTPTPATPSPQPQEAGKRDKTKYMLNGNVYLKNKLVLAVVSDYVKKHPTITCQELKTVFDKTLQGSMGVVENAETAYLRSDYLQRFFAKPEETLILTDGKMLVCNQWGILNIPRFIARAKELGYEIKEIRA